MTITADPEWTFAYPFSEDRALISTGPRWGYIGTSGEMAIELDFVRARGSGDFSGGFAAVETKDGGLSGYVDTRGELVIEPKFRSAYEFSEGMAAVSVPEEMGYGMGYIDRSEELVIGPNPEFEQARPFSEGRATVQVNGRWGYLNPSGDMVIGPRFDHAQDFACSLALVGEEGRVGYIDGQGRWVRSWAAPEDRM